MHSFIRRMLIVPTRLNWLLQGCDSTQKCKSNWMATTPMRTNSNFVSAFKCVHENSPRFVSVGEDVQEPADVRLCLLRRRVLLHGGRPVGLWWPGQGADGQLWSPAARGDLSCCHAGLGGRGGALGTCGSRCSGRQDAPAATGGRTCWCSPWACARRWLECGRG
jgi:hypothetical protein